ncbi:MAG: 50S ribosomal protein L10 [Candidatus Moranbacteria bacterium GW2011_GWE1_49_15]|nr:MAG: 50S ribosomal protein L10 [Candidatus Moranbacteria bacterium GW2011_GWE2_47_10]KKW06921.1 MAG: 50S ribosomal protein L10 [Candidatus Moranbacteria bacterium GW2011_GWE1_49_15]
MITKEQKKQIVKDLAQKAKESKSIVFVDYKGIQVKDVTDLKKQLREAGVEYVVSRKTLIDIALKEAGIETSVRGLEGQIAVSFSKEDEVAAAKIIDKFAKTNENLKMLGGVLGTQVMDEKEVKALAKIPSKEELLAKLVGSLKSPVSGFVNVLGGNLRGLVHALNAIKEQKA